MENKAGTVIERLFKYLEFKGIPPTRFEKQVGIANGLLQRRLSNKGSLNEVTLKKIAEHTPDLNPLWLIFEKGEMIIEAKQNDNQDPKNQFISKSSEINFFVNVPLVTVPAQASYLKGFGDNEYIENLPTFPVLTDRHYKGKYRIFEVHGDSMDDNSKDSILDGDKLLCREVKRELWTSKLHINTWDFVIVHNTDGITIKTIIEHDTKNGIITCAPRNPEYDSFTINLNEVAEIYNVIKVVDRTLRK